MTNTKCWKWAYYIGVPFYMIFLVGEIYFKMVLVVMALYFMVKELGITEFNNIWLSVMITGFIFSSIIYSGLRSLEVKYKESKEE